MARRFVCVFFFFIVALLFSGGQAALNFHDIWNLALPQSTSPVKSSVDGPSHKAVSVDEEEGGAGGVSGHSKTTVDFGTRGWPYVYYSRRDAKGTVDWGNLAWPYVYYSKNEGKDDASASAAAVIPAAIPSGRKGGAGFKL